jgi:hypothetical protein
MLMVAVQATRASTHIHARHTGHADCLREQIDGATGG